MQRRTNEVRPRTAAKASSFFISSYFKLVKLLQNRDSNRSHRVYNRFHRVYSKIEFASELTRKPELGTQTRSS
ncbi:hypothetical protein VIGAN_04167600 [Vigna angularis var. angularis]|uniref:Uncharacterized protein n=1 Tax=Vigna angularis var. angularis TaxID=157739 RepID=A0A0S3RUQ0_PHAAN|nr:hypothetical protein VIGAN_04167600 [Vigna angularis var. angularis]